MEHSVCHLKKGTKLYVSNLNTHRSEVGKVYEIRVVTNLKNKSMYFLDNKVITGTSLETTKEKFVPFDYDKLFCD